MTHKTFSNTVQISAAADDPEAASLTEHIQAELDVSMESLKALHARTLLFGPEPSPPIPAWKKRLAWKLWGWATTLDPSLIDP
jgi:hypothetical protein